LAAIGAGLSLERVGDRDNLRLTFARRTIGTVTYAQGDVYFQPRVAVYGRSPREVFAAWAKQTFASAN
jgi:hypothetical protein